ncbi:rRNA-binding ribosome biosynthesis protein utp25 [Dinochytrium kinnereticum]|nr:rRNA-binding ribosome biosynthesis protein utp25 [Dinochytrium kinnereticum]
MPNVRTPLDTFANHKASAPDQVTAVDAFESHFSDENSDLINTRIDELSKGSWTKTSFFCEHFHSLQLATLDSEAANDKFIEAYNEPDAAQSGVKKRLLNPFESLKKDADMSSLQKRFFHLLSTYTDFLATNHANLSYEDLRLCYHLHIMNHIFKTRDRVMKNNARVKETSTESDERDFKDQGFTRPKVLLLLPTKHLALKAINNLIALSGATHIDNKTRFETEFGMPEDEDVIDEKKPDDFKEDFAGNIDDCFRIGVKFSRKHLKLFSDFFSSDVIIASPLGLRLVIEKEGGKAKDIDFLSSIEIVIADRCDYMLMQNWDHVQLIFDSLNKVPAIPRDADFSRIKAWYLDGSAKYLRQTILISKFQCPEVTALFNRSCLNIFGKIKATGESVGLVSKVVSQIPQLFYKVPCDKITEADNARFHFFVQKVVPEMMSSSTQSQQVLVFIPSYFDFVRIRNHFAAGSYSFGELSEYTKNSDISRARGNFFEGKIDFILYTERFHFFRSSANMLLHRYRIRNVKHILFYALPETSHFYPEIVNLVEAADGSCTCLFTKYDKFRLERIVGSDRLSKVIGKETFLFA